MADLTETSLSSEELLNGKLLHVYRDEVRLPDGRSATREWIDHPGAVAIVPIFEDGSTVLVRQFRFPTGRSFLEVPAGKFDSDNESPEDVGRRELKEETGIRADTLTHVGAFYPCIGYSNEMIHVCIARGLTQGDMELTDDEFIEPVRLPFTEAVARARNGTLSDMKTITALNRVHYVLEQADANF